MKHQKQGLAFWAASIKNLAAKRASNDPVFQIDGRTDPRLTDQPRVVALISRSPGVERSVVDGPISLENMSCIYVDALVRHMERRRQLSLCQTTFEHGKCNIIPFDPKRKLKRGEDRPHRVDTATVDERANKEDDSQA